jgi:hypothetical protein
VRAVCLHGHSPMERSHPMFQFCIVSIRSDPSPGTGSYSLAWTCIHVVLPVLRSGDVACPCLWHVQRNSCPAFDVCDLSRHGHRQGIFCCRLLFEHCQLYIGSDLPCECSYRVNKRRKQRRQSRVRLAQSPFTESCLPFHHRIIMPATWLLHFGRLVLL